MKNIIFIAPPSAGKGTYARILSETYKIPHISMGSMLRQAAKRQDELGIYLQEAMAHAELIQDEIVYRVLKERLKEKDCKKGYILDGFPRTIAQAETYEELLKELKKELGVVFVIDIDKNTLISRVTGRRTCENCGAIYNLNIEESLPKNSSICDNCGKELIQRQDDNLETFEARYQTYLEEEKALIDFYKKKKVLYHLNGNLSKEKVLSKMEKILMEEREVK